MRNFQVQMFLEAIYRFLDVQEGALKNVTKKSNDIILKTQSNGKVSSLPKTKLPLDQKLFDEAISNARGATSGVSEVARTLAILFPLLSWYQRSVVGQEKFSRGHANCQILGPKGIELRDDLTIGLSLLAPEVVYPEHKHKPEEIYMVMSSGQWRQECKNWVSPDIGGLIYNPSDVLHSMRAEQKPLLTVWLLDGVL